MQLWESVLIALRGLTTNKLRTALTMLGIIIGVAAVIALLSIGKGFERSFNRSIESMGTNVLWIIEGNFDIFGGSESSASSRQVSGRQRAAEPLTMGDIRAMANPARVAGVAAVAPVYQGWPRSVIRGQTEVTNSTITGVTPEYESVRNVILAMGNFISEMDLNRRSRVVVLGANVADELFEAFESPLGQTVKLNGIPFKVIGVMAEKERGIFGDENNDVLIPLSTAQTRLYKAGAFRGELKVSAIYVQVTTQAQMDSVSDEIDRVLREQHRIGPDDEKDFTIISQGELLEFGSSITAALSVFLGSIAAVSLLVGGIGIMNIMLVSVTERTREIGIRKAVGAKRRDILLQFLVEAIVLSLIGGFLGIGLGYSVSALLPVLMPDFEETVVTLDSILLATSFAAAVGLFFGVYPATRAARLKPIEALRYE
ncbi:MAG: ABC transporter permease [Anaerolineae bacterium]|nr:ABC transporter permease [Anaerolineae bacterium]